MLFLRVARNAEAKDVGTHLEQIWILLQDLRDGKHAQLPDVSIPPSGLNILFAYGQNIFNISGVNSACPSALKVAKFRPPEPSGGGRILIESGIRYASHVSANPATEDIAIQLTADTPLAISRAILEIQLFLDGIRNPEESASITIVETYTGFNREDHRSWIDFHDGISNLKSGTERQSALEIDSEDAAIDGWTKGGSYLAFLRLAVDVTTWRSISLNAQELVVGRKKISGCAIADVNDDENVSVAGCPLTGTQTIMDGMQTQFFEPPRNPANIVKSSHVQRANHHGPPAEESSSRIFRQGYEFLETPASGRNLRAGLNFVSFQDTPQRLLFMLKQTGWLGGVNFGGADSLQTPELANLLTAYAAAFFICPPANADGSLPGRHLFFMADA